MAVLKSCLNDNFHTLISSSKCFSKENYLLKTLSTPYRPEASDMFFIYTSPLPVLSNISFSLRSIILVLGNGAPGEYDDSRRFKLILWGIIAGTRGGPNRAKILNLLYSKSLNEFQISKELKLDHKTIHHHLIILIKNSLISKPSEESYDIKYDLTPIMKQNYTVLEEIISKIKR